MPGDRVEVRLLGGWTPGVVRRLRDSIHTVDGRELRRVDVDTEVGLFPALHPLLVRTVEEGS